jgi:hypothetical protein
MSGSAGSGNALNDENGVMGHCTSRHCKHGLKLHVDIRRSRTLGAYMAIQSKTTPMFHRRSFIVASAAAAIAPDFARAQSPVPDQLDWGRMTRADRDLAYNNGAAVPDSAQIMERIIAAIDEFARTKIKAHRCVVW